MVWISSRCAALAMLFVLALIGIGSPDIARAQGTQNGVFIMQADGSDVRRVIQVEGC